MRSLGFGLERVGLLVLRAPRLVAALVAVLTLGGLATLPQTSFDGRLIDILSENEAFEAYSEVKEGFRDASHDAFLMVQSPRLLTADGLEALRFFHLDLATAEPVRSVYSVFSLGEVDIEAETYRPALPGIFTTDAEANAAIEALLADQAEARALISPEDEMAVVVATLDAPVNADNDVMASYVAALQATIDDIAPADFTVIVTGLPAVQATVADSLQTDQWRLALFGVLIGAAIGFVVFRSAIAALACALPAGVAVIWLTGLFNLLGVEINFLFILLPSLALILALVDSIVFFFHWQTANAENGALYANLRASIRRVGPASAMTSVTTALAFASFAYADNPALHMLAWLGVAAVGLAFLAFITVLPLLCLAIIRLPTAAGRMKPAFSGFGGPVGRVATRGAWYRVGLAIALTLVLGFVHFEVRSNFDLERYLPPGDSVVETERLLADRFGGTAPLYAVVDVPEGAAFYEAPARERIATVAAIFDRVVGEGVTNSLAAIWSAFDEDGLGRAADLIAEIDPGALDRVLSIDQRQMLVTRQLPSVMPGEEIAALVDRLNRELSAAGLADAVALTGFPVLSAVEIPALVEELRFGLIIAVVLAVGAIAIASRSLGIALACLVPNILPILVVEGVLYVMGFDHDLTSVVALTIAFGIGIDNAVHIVNMYRLNRAEGIAPPEALSQAIQVVGPALMASTAILGLSYLATQISSMPSIGLLGQLIIATLIAALMANLLFLPSFIAVLDRGFRRMRRGLGSAQSGVS